jgi:DNA-binding IclR family transcriptional regulator
VQDQAANELDRPTGDKTPSLSALDKATLVLEAIVSYTRPVGLPDLTADLGLPRQTIHRILQQLCDNGLIVRDPSRDRYAVGPRLSKLAMATLSSDNHRAPLRAVLTELVADIGETCNFGVLDGLEFMYLDRLECSWSLRVHLSAGSRVPAYCTSGGKALLAHLDKPLRNALIRSRKLEAYTDRTTTNPDQLEAELDDILTQGYALNNEEHTVGVVGAAVPIISGSGRALGALALHGPSQRLTIAEAKKHVPRLRAAAVHVATMWSTNND